jgi:hypothetical protein
MSTLALIPVPTLEGALIFVVCLLLAIIVAILMMVFLR